MPSAHSLKQAVPPNARLSRHHRLHDFAMHVGQAVVAALEFERQPRVSLLRILHLFAMTDSDDFDH